ncbi:hypothetical protein DY000_02015800 [Brassica cretica]|uniref:DUF4283 domain-containing protein n=1 Tax=Brassica cretica TaxID=69181 RepID=A0ABQ7CPS0_BRACR|nr:hypothetical protein DY000_02015800 [Brassica cretica]
MVDLSICCSEHDVSRCFSEHGGTPLMSWRSWPEPANGPLGAKPCLGGCRVDELWSWTSWTPFYLGRFPLVQASYLIKGRFPFILRQDKSLALDVGGWRQGTRPGGRDPDLGAGTRDLDAGTWKPEAGEISSWNIFPQQFAPYFLVSCLMAGNNMDFFIGLRELHRSIKFLVEFGVGRQLVAWAIKLPCLMRRFPHGGDWSELAESLMEKPETGSLNCVEECMGQDPGILRGRILARLRIRGMRRFNKTRRPKLRILMLDSAGLARIS